MKKSILMLPAIMTAMIASSCGETPTSQTTTSEVPTSEPITSETITTVETTISESVSSEVPTTEITSESISQDITEIVPFNDEYLEMGYKWSASFPEQIIKDFIGNQNIEFAIPSLSNGVYYIEYEADDDYVAYVEVISKGRNQCEGYLEQMIQKGSKEYYYDDYYEFYGALDATHSYEVDFLDNGYYDENDEYYELDETVFDFYRVDDLFYDGTKTTNTEWDDEIKNAMVAITGEVLPFVQLGENYGFEDYTEFSYNYLDIYDFSYDSSLLNGYGEKLVSAGYSYDELYDYYTKAYGSYNVIIVVSWNSYGNDILITTDEEF